MWLSDVSSNDFDEKAYLNDFLTPTESLDESKIILPSLNNATSSEKSESEEKKVSGHKGHRLGNTMSVPKIVVKTSIIIVFFIGGHKK